MLLLLKRHLVILPLLFLNLLHSQAKERNIYADTIPDRIIPSVINRLEIPRTTSKEKIITHTGYSLSYNEAHEQANWVAYELTKAETNKLYSRTNKFMVDPAVKTGTANDGDYKGSGYDRGHLAPAADMGWSASTMRESFYYSNMSPQEPGFNRGIWKRLEEQVRTWAIENQSVYIVTGPILNSISGSIGANQVSIPKYYYKVILDYKEPQVKGIGFIMPNRSSSASLQAYAVSIDSVEHLSGIDFFPALPDDQERIIESQINVGLWSWNSTHSTTHTSKTYTAAQCQGITQSGNQCRNHTTNTNGYCYLHQAQSDGVIANSSTHQSAAVQCSGYTKSGKMCTRMTSNSNGRCYQH